MDSRPPVTVIVLAAGCSTRFGSNKLLHHVDGAVPMIRRVVQTAGSCGFHEIVVVVGHDSEAVKDALVGLPVRFVENRRYAEGIATSIHAGVEAARAKNSGYLVILGDMPYITPATLLALADGRAADRLAACRAEDGGPMVPAFFGHDYRRRLEALHGDRGARALLIENLEHAKLIAVPPDELRDVDVPE